MARINEHTDLSYIVEVMEVENALKGKRFSITGHLGRTRKEFVEIIQQAGGYFDKGPSYSTDYLITNNDWNANSTVRKGASRKLLKAQREGVKIITEAQFYEMITAHGETCADGGTDGMGFLG
jgi:NAD-dependent DNA ligase